MNRILFDIISRRTQLFFMSQQASCIDLDSDAEGGIVITYVVMGVECFSLYLYHLNRSAWSITWTCWAKTFLELEQALPSGGEISSVEEADDGKLQWYSIMNRTILHTFMTRMNLVKWLQITILWFVARHSRYSICFDTLNTMLLAFTKSDTTQTQGSATASSLKSWKSWTKPRQLN